MAYEIKVTKWHAGVLIDIETRIKVMKKFGTHGESKSEAIAKALEVAVSDVVLTKAEVEKARLESDENLRKRMIVRENKKRNRNLNRKRNPEHE